MPKTLRQLKDEYINLLEDLNANLRGQLELTPGLLVPGAARGAVYILKQSGTTNYKIGFTTNYPQRKALFDIRLPFQLEETHIHYTNRFREVERALHAHFSDARLNGSEFFALSDEQVQSLPALIGDIEERVALESEKARLAVPEHSESPDQPITMDRDVELVSKAQELMQTQALTPETISKTFLQTRLGIGYARAARLKDRLIAESAK